MQSPMGSSSAVLWAPASEGSCKETVRFNCAAGAGLVTIVLVVEGDGSVARTAPCTVRGSWVPAGGRIGCKGKAGGWDGTAALGNGEWLAVRPDG